MKKASHVIEFLLLFLKQDGDRRIGHIQMRRLLKLLHQEDHRIYLFYVTKACWDYVDGNMNNAVYIKDLYLKDHFCKTNMLSWWPMSATVAVFTIELAMYMGFKEIILLGYDCTFSVRGSRHAGNEEIYKQDDAFLEKDRNRLKDRHMSIEEYDKHLLNMIMSDYKSDREYAEKHGVKIWNATRGGRLEIFKRKQLEDFF